jgi:hypothetical protein
MKIRKWSEKEFSLIRDNSNLSYEDLAKKLNRSVLAVKQVIWKAKGNLRKTAAWKDRDIKLLRDNFNKSYSELEKLLGRTKRAIKHKVGQLGLKRDERRRISKEEEQCILDTRTDWSEEIAGKLKRSKFCVARLKRKLLGSANPRFKDNWDKPSKDLAYFLGAVCSDIGVYRYKLSVVQGLTRHIFIEKIKDIVHNIFGLDGKNGIIEIKGVKYSVFSVFSTEFLRNLATEDGLKHGNIRGSDGEWINFIDEKFNWVFKDEFFWDFVGGWYDGDGCLVRRKSGYFLVKIGVKPLRSRTRMIEEFAKKGFDFAVEFCNGVGTQIVLLGGQKSVDSFIKKVRCVINYKRDKNWKFQE